MKRQIVFMAAAASTLALCAADFGKLSDGRSTHVYRLSGAGGLILDVSDYGGRVVRLYAPDRFGNLADVTLGWNTAAEYEKFGFSMGTLIGRYGNRIAHGRFILDGKTFQLPLNEVTATRHCNLHGGPQGWDTKVWKARLFREGDTPAIELAYVSPDGEMGFPGTVECKVVYRVRPDNVWTVDYEAKTDKPTVLNLTHHSYWNLAGEGSGDVLGQQLRIFADEYTQTNAGMDGEGAGACGDGQLVRPQLCAAREMRRAASGGVDARSGVGAAAGHLDDRALHAGVRGAEHGRLAAGEDGRAQLPAVRRHRVGDAALPGLSEQARLPVDGAPSGGDFPQPHGISFFR